MKPQKHAFSLMEMAAVLIIVGIFIAGIFASSIFFTKFRIAAAQTLTRSSPVHNIKDSALWLETSLENSFNKIESNDTSPLTTWYEQRNNINKVFLQAADGGPTYSNTINRIHAVKFEGTGYFTFDGSFLNDTDYTITVLEKREASGGDNYFLGDSSVTTTNQNLLLGYSADGQIAHSQGGSSAYAGLVSDYSSSSNNPRIFTFTHSATAGKKTYINGVLAAQDETNLEPLTGLSTLSLGKGYSGQIGELIIFTRALEADEIKSVEKYLAQKFNSKLIETSSSDCLGQVVTLNGCETSGGASATCNVAVTGVSSTTPVASGSGDLTCDSSNYSHSPISYTCAGGILSTASSCTCATGFTGAGCSGFAAGYVSNGSGGARLGNACSTSTVAGVTSPTTVAHEATGTLNCTATGYSGTSAYSCSDGTLTAATCACDTASGYSLVSGVCTNAATMSCTGGTPTTVGGYKIHTFTSSGTLTCSTGGTAQVLVVGGGGGGSSDVGGGGGGGQVVESTLAVSASATITVGAGGARGYNRVTNSTCSGSTGATSSIVSGGTTIQALGGSGARGRSGGFNNALAGTGYTGGGAAYPDGTSVGSTGTGGAGYKGGDGHSSYGGGGGGGAGGVGQSRPAGGNGGVGVESSLSGSSVYYGGGGGGSGYSSGAAGSGGLGGGGAGTSNTDNGFDGTNGLGGGGGGAGSNGSSSAGGGVGGSGVVIVRYLDGPPTNCAVSVTGITTPTTVNVGTSDTLPCNTPTYSGSVDYTCPSSGTLSVTGSCTAPILSYVVLTSGSSYTVQSGFTQAKVWAIGAGGGGGGAGGSGGGGGAGGVAYKTWSVAAGNTISYSLGSGGAGGIGSGQTGATGGNTTVTFSGTTITANGGGGGRGDNATASVGGSFSGGDGGAAGGGTVGISGDRGGSAGAAIGGVNGTVPPDTTFGGTGANSADVSGLFAALSAEGSYTTTSGGAGSNSSKIGDQINHGSAATGFGCGGGGAGWWGGNGGSGKYGGGGGGAAAEGGSRTGGAGGGGVVVIKFW